MTKTVNATYDQDRFAEVQNDAADESATLGTLNGDFSKDPDITFRVRFTVQQTATAATDLLTVTPTLFYSYNAGAWTEVGNPTDTDAPIRVVNEANVTDNATTTLRLGSGDSNVAGRFEDTAPGATAVTFTNTSTGEATEYEWALELYSGYAGIANDDTIALRVYNTATALDTYTNEPTITATGLGVVHDLLADDVESASETSAPVITQLHVLNAADTESASETSAPVITQLHVLLADDTESTSETSAPGVSQLHVLLADDVESSSETSTPAVTDIAGSTGLLIIPDPRFEAPELFEPGRKPVGKVVVDWNHRLAIGLTSFNLMRNDLDDLVTGGSLVRASSIYSYFNVKNAQQSLRLDKTATSSKVTATKRIVDDSSPHTMLCCVSMDTAASTGIDGFYTENDGTSHHILRMLSSTSFEFLINGLTNDRVNHSFSPVSGSPYVAGGSWGGSGTALNVITYDDTNKLKRTVNGSTSTGTFQAGNPTYSSPGAWNNQSGNYYWFVCWDHVLTDSQINDFIRKPYQFLIPA